MSARADQFTFSFNSLSSGANSSQIQTYMDSLLGSGKSVTVTGAVADQTYTGEGHVVGPNRVSLTLGNTDGATSVSSTSTLNGSKDTFIANTNDSSVQISNEISMVFQGLTINGTVSFDYEIFPDGSGQTPDFEFEAGLAGHTSLVSAFGTNGVQLGVAPGTGPYSLTTSPDSNHEASLQYIGHWSGTITGATELDFVDWPATIAIDNLVITTNPEPSAFVLLGTVLAGLVYLQRKKRLPSIRS